MGTDGDRDNIFAKKNRFCNSKSFRFIVLIFHFLFDIYLVILCNEAEINV